MTTPLQNAEKSPDILTTAAENAAKDCAIAIDESYARSMGFVVSPQDAVAHLAPMLLKPIQTHLAPVKAELERKDKEIAEASRWVKESVSDCPSCGDLVIECKTCVKKKAWLERNK